MTETTLLIVDDEPVVLTSMIKILSPHYMVRAAISGARMLQIVTSAPRPELILLDVQMPEMDGYAVLSRLKENPDTREIPVIFVTAMESSEEEEKGLILGAADYIKKPFVPSVLLARIKAQLVLKQARDFLHDKNDYLEAEVSRRIDVAEKTLKENEQRWQFALKGNRDGIWDWNVLNNKVFFSTRWKGILGFEESEIGSELDEWKKRIHPDDKEQVNADINRCYTGVTPFYENEHRMLCKDGSYKWILARGMVVSWSDDHKPQRMTGTHSDITEQKFAKEALELSEQMFRTMFEEAPLGVAVIDSLTGSIYQVNARFAEISGRGREEMIGLDWMSITHPEDVQEDLDNMALLNAGKISRFNMIKRCRHPDETYVWINMSIAPMSVADKACPRHLCMIEDISEQKQTEEVLRRAQKMEAIGNLTGGIAHDFNNLLGIVQGNLEILERELDGQESMHKRIGSALAGVKRGEDITKRLLQFSRPKANSDILFSLNQNIVEMELLLTKSVMKKISIKLVLKQGLWLCKINEGDFQDALLNIVFNARDAMPEGGSVLIETTNKVLDTGYTTINPGVDAGEYVQVSVSDSGCGMATEIQEKVFDPFFTTKVKGKGTGLGLSMVYGFVTRSHGHLKLYSELGHGTTVHMYFPRVMTAGSSVTLKNEPQGEMNLPTGDETILIVDDEQGLLDLAQYFLQHCGYKVIVATNSAEALEMLSLHKGKIDLLFSDIIMPGEMDGLALASKVVELYPAIKILLTSGFSDEAVKLNGLAKYKGKLLDKPYSREELSIAVRRVLGSK